MYINSGVVTECMVRDRANYIISEHQNFKNYVHI